MNNISIIDPEIWYRYHGGKKPLLTEKQPFLLPLIKYLQSDFIKDLQKMKFSKPNKTLIGHDSRIDGNTRFFGGREWENMESDLKGVKEQNKAFFCFCLFMMVRIDQNMFDHFNQHYIKFRESSPLPKFGWCGFETHFENPHWLIDMPAANGVNFEVISNQEIGELFSALLDAAIRFFGNKESGVDFFKLLIAGEDFITENDLSARIKEAIKFSEK